MGSLNDCDLTSRLYISTLARDAAALARDNGLGLEIAEFCTAYNMDTDLKRWDEKVRSDMRGVERLIFHAPFNELCPAAIDPLIVAVAQKRYRQAYALMRGYGIDVMIAHAGFLPVIYDEEWFVEKSAAFWRAFLSDKPDTFRLYIENVFETSPDVLCRLVSVVDDERFRLCLDIGHTAVSGKRTPVVEWVEQTLPFLGHVHLHNNYGELDSHNMPGDGIVDAVGLIRTIARADRRVTFAIESSGGKQSVEWMRSVGFL